MPCSITVEGERGERKKKIVCQHEMLRSARGKGRRNGCNHAYCLEIRRRFAESAEGRAGVFGNNSEKNTQTIHPQKINKHRLTQPHKHWPKDASTGSLRTAGFVVQCGAARMADECTLYRYIYRRKS